MKRKYPEIKIGEVYDNLEIIEERVGKDYTRYYKTRCIKCGREKELPRSCIYNHRGTMHSACGKGVKTKDKKFYSAWQNLRTRTGNENYDHYNSYGGRGINSDYFANFIDFYDTMYESYKEALEKYGKDSCISIDRIDVNGNYEPSNCQWIPMCDQHGNTQKNKRFKAISPDGEEFYSKNQSEFAREHNLSDKQINACLSGRFKTTQKWRFSFID